MGLVMAVPLVAAVRIPAAERRRALAVLLLPLVTGIVLMSVSLLAENWDAFYARYLYRRCPASRCSRRSPSKGARRARRCLELGRADGPATAALGAPVDGHAGDGLAPLEDHEVAVARLRAVGAAQVIVQHRDPGGLAGAVGLGRRGDRRGPADDERRPRAFRSRTISRWTGARGHDAGRLDVVARSGWAGRPARRRAGSPRSRGPSGAWRRRSGSPSGTRSRTWRTARSSGVRPASRTRTPSAGGSRSSA